LSEITWIGDSNTFIARIRFITCSVFLQPSASVHSETYFTIFSSKEPCKILYPWTYVLQRNKLLC